MPIKHLRNICYHNYYYYYHCSATLPKSWSLASSIFSFMNTSAKMSQMKENMVVSMASIGYTFMNGLNWKMASLAFESLLPASLLPFTPVLHIGTSLVKLSSQRAKPDDGSTDVVGLVIHSVIWDCNSLLSETGSNSAGFKWTLLFVESLP